MSLLSYNELCKLVEQGVIEGAKLENVNSASIDLTLGRNIYDERSEEFYRTGTTKLVDMLDKTSNHLVKFVMSDEGYVIPPGASILAETVEVFNLPNDISAEYKLKSTMARNFVDHYNAGWADAGWHGSVLTLELVNHNQFHSVRIKPGQKCGQMVFFKHEEVPSDRSYATRGQYNNDKEVMTGKGLK